MKRTKLCPKCGSSHILRVEDTAGDQGIGLVLGWFSSVPVARYVCCGCGYAESWVDEKFLNKLRERYEKEQRK